ncbi:polymorphic toxin type 50 domain-containing protein [Peptoniphilus sp. KCTC 25270]|uniref:polymorphic toxin type 50 domain-containing protein n=1 Tax=Peptoniphilus sp. KCTC 25270 TaxID=2897414 RepID=UPI001E3048C2|nr:polymorphic toxin type 50 domain-containing protein [Peptoniphilus sp. KCTC 25270]MCD1147091.1 polymorphic toxin type 50 domain-containing protein [Peptoniphilus sp. KCTC 25270]
MTYREWHKEYVEGNVEEKRDVRKLTQYSSAIEILGRVKNGEIKLNLNHEHYEKHYKGTNQYNNYLESRRNRGWGPQARLIISEEEAQKIIYEYHGKGIVYKSGKNKDKITEEVNVGKVIGYYVDKGKEYAATKVRIYYSKYDTHVVPIRGNNFD